MEVSISSFHSIHHLCLVVYALTSTALPPCSIQPDAQNVLARYDFIFVSGRHLRYVHVSAGAMKLLWDGMQGSVC